MRNLECSHLCMFLGKLRREHRLGMTAIGARVADFLEPLVADLAVGGGDGGDDPHGFVRFYDSKTAELVHEIALPDAVFSVAYSPCSTRLAIGDVWGGVVRLLEMDTLTTMQEHRLGWESDKFFANLRVAFAPGGGLLGVVCVSGHIWILDPETLEVHRTADVDECVSSLAFSPSGDTLALGGFEGTLRFFEPGALTELRSVRLHGGDGDISVWRSVAFHPVGQCLAFGTSGRDGSFLQLLDTSTMSVLHEVEVGRNDSQYSFAKYPDPYIYIMYSPEGGQLMVSCSRDAPVRIYDSGTLQLLNEIDYGALVFCFACAPASAGGFEEQLDVIQQGVHDRPSAVAAAAVVAPFAPVPAAAASASEKKEEVPDADLLQALQLSEEEDLQRALREGRDVLEALLLSKADALSADGVVLSRLTFHTPDITAFLTNSDCISDARSRMESAGCELHPSWANGALLLVPVMEEQVMEAGIQLKPHNILMLSSDVELVRRALSSLPRRKRPRVMPECHADANGNLEPSPADLADGTSRVDEAGPVTLGHGAQHSAMWMEEIGLVVERTFLGFQLDKQISEVSTPMQSEPAATGGVPPGHVNPHRWRLFAARDSL